MQNKSKVVPIREDSCKIVAEDEQASRFILGIGKHRIAFDFTSKLTRLPDGAGDQPAPVVPMKTKKRERPK